MFLKVQPDIAKLNGENGDFLKGTDMAKYSKYESTARTMLRLMWFLDFVFYMLNGLVSD
jgi:phage portal protein BeeE